MNPRRWPVLATVCLGLVVPTVHGQPQGPELAQTVTTEPSAALTLADCVRIGLDRQPALAAYRASLAAAETQQHALDKLCLASLISRELPIRRQQAAQGVAIAAAGLQQAEWEAIYAVTRNYFSVLYAHKQEALVRGLVTRLKAAQEKAAALVKAGNPDYVVTDIDIDRLAAGIDLLRLKEIEAIQGVKRAGAALREAMGVGPDYCLVLARDELPPLQDNLCRDDLIALALSRRGDAAPVPR